MSNPPAGKETPRTDAAAASWKLPGAKTRPSVDDYEWMANFARTLERELSAAKAQLAEAQQAVEVGLQIAGSFFGALKPLNLTHINVANPGQHITDLIAQLTTAREDMKEECAKVAEDLTVPTEWFQGHIQQCRTPVPSEIAAAIRALKTSAVKEKNVGAK